MADLPFHDRSCSPSGRADQRLVSAPRVLPPVRQRSDSNNDAGHRQRSVDGSQTANPTVAATGRTPARPNSRISPPAAPPLVTRPPRLFGTPPATLASSLRLAVASPPASHVFRAQRVVRRTDTEVNAAPAGRLYEGDCLEVLRLLPPKTVDLVLCDLPYGTTRNKWDSVIDLPALWREYRRVLKPRGAVALTGQGLFTARLILSNAPWFRYKIIWVKSKPTNFLNARVQPLRKHEDICIFYQDHPTYNPQMTPGLPYDKGIRKAQLSGSYGDFQPAHIQSNGDRFPCDVVYFKTAESEPEQSVWHPTQKPVELGRYLVRTFSNPGDLVLDNAFGSGSFLVAAHLEERRFCGIEKNREVHRFKKHRIDYMEVAHSRLTARSADCTIIRA